MMQTTTDFQALPPDERLALYEAMFFDCPKAWAEFCGLSPEQHGYVLQDALDLCTETGSERVGMFNRARLGELLRYAERRADDCAHQRFLDAQPDHGCARHETPEDCAFFGCSARGVAPPSGLAVARQLAMQVEILTKRLDRLEAACAGLLRDYEFRQALGPHFHRPNGDC